MSASKIRQDKLSFFYSRTKDSAGTRSMASTNEARFSTLFSELLGDEVVLDLRSPYVCLGTLKRADSDFLELINADLHDFRDSSATREVYIFDSRRLGIRRNRERVLIRRDDIVAIARFRDIVGS